MDKNKIIDDILNEWAMRSHDGLASGHNTPENSAILRDILAERGITSEANEIKPLNKQYFGKDENDELVAMYHPLYPDGTTYADVKAGTALTRDQVAKLEKTKKQKSASVLGTKSSEKLQTTEKSSGFTVQGLINEKGFTEGAAAAVIQSAKENLTPDVFRDFATTKYNSFTDVEKTAEFINRGFRSDYAGFFIDVEENIRVNGSFVKTQVGRGEFVFALLLKGCQTMGQKSGDLKLANGLVVDVKEMDAGGQGIFRVPLTVFGGTGAFNRLRFPHALNQFFSYCKSTPEAQQILINMVQQDIPITKGYKSVMEFLHELSWDKIGVKSLNGLFEITKYIQQIPPSELEKMGLGNKVEFDFDGEEHILSLNDMKPEDREKIRNPKTEKETVKVAVSAITDKSNELIVPQIKSLELFRDPKGRKYNAFLSDTIATEMFENMKHYSGGIIFCERDSKSSNVASFYYEPDLRNLKRPFIFYNYSQSNVGFKRIDSGE